MAAPPRGHAPLRSLAEGNLFVNIDSTEAARCLAQSPKIYSQLKNGTITLCSLSEVTTVFTPENQERVLTAIQGASKREAQAIAQSTQNAEIGRAHV